MVLEHEAKHPLLGHLLGILAQWSSGCLWPGGPEEHYYKYGRDTLLKENDGASTARVRLLVSEGNLTSLTGKNQ